MGRLLSITAVVLMLSPACSPSSKLGYETIEIGDKRLAEFSSMNDVDREGLGFPHLPTRGKVVVERSTMRGAESEGYDALLKLPHEQFGDSVFEWLVIFEKVGHTYHYIGESITYQGPREYGTVEKTREILVVTYKLKPCLRSKETGLIIQYFGPDLQMQAKALSVADAKALVSGWGIGQKWDER